MKLISHRVTEVGAKALAIMALLLSGAFFCRFGNFQAHCLRSNIFDKLVLISSDQQVRNCSRWLEGVLTSGTLPDSLLLQRRWLEELTPLRQLILPSHTLTNVLLVDERPFLSRTFKNHLFLSMDLGQKKREFQIQAVRQVLAEGEDFFSHFESRILAEFYVSILNNENLAISLDGSREKANDQIHWWSFGFNHQEYCQSTWRTVDEIEVCTTEFGENFRTLLVRGLYEIYRRANFTGRSQLISWIRSEVLTGKASLLHSRPPDEYGDAKGWLRFEMERWAQSCGLSIPLESIFADLQIDDSSSQLLGVGGISETEEWLSAKIPIWWIDRKLLWNDGEYRYQNPNSLPKTTILFTCKMPNAHMIRNVATESVLVVSQCQGGKPLRLRSLVKGQLEDFVSDNPDLGLIWIRVNELTKVVRNHSTEFNTPVSLGTLRRWSLWKEDVWDKAQKVFIPRAAREIVRSHRASREML